MVGGNDGVDNLIVTGWHRNLGSRRSHVDGFTAGLRSRQISNTRCYFGSQSNGSLEPFTCKARGWARLPGAGVTSSPTSASSSGILTIS
jgi:hypothetical protein